LLPRNNSGSSDAANRASPTKFLFLCEDLPRELVHSSRE
jgi:hypothetical protein